MASSFGLNTKISKNVLKKVKSRYILKRIMKNVEMLKSFEIIRYNKKMQNDLNIDIDDYKKHSMIKIEIIPAENKYGKFININNNKDKSHYHIYFDDNNEENKIYDIDERMKVKKITVKIDYQVNSFGELFDNCDCISSIYFKIFNRDNITNMNSMFARCTSLKEIYFSNFITDNVTDMGLMFYECTSLKEINLLDFNTDNVKDMFHMFSGCSSLKELNLCKFNTNKVKDMRNMFAGCSSLKEINLSNFTFNNKTYQNKMFSGCSEELKLKIKAQYQNIRNEAFD